MRNFITLVTSSIKSIWDDFEEEEKTAVIVVAETSMMWAIAIVIFWVFLLPPIQNLGLELSKSVHKALDTFSMNPDKIRKVARQPRLSGQEAIAVTEAEIIDKVSRGLVDDTMLKTADYDLWSGLLLCFYPDARNIALHVASRRVVTERAKDSELPTNLWLTEAEQTVSWDLGSTRFSTNIKLYGEELRTKRGEPMMIWRAFAHEHEGSPKPKRNTCKGSLVKRIPNYKKEL